MSSISTRRIWSWENCAGCVKCPAAIPAARSHQLQPDKIDGIFIDGARGDLRGSQAVSVVNTQNTPPDTGQAQQHDIRMVVSCPSALVTVSLRPTRYSVIVTVISTRSNGLSRPSRLADTTLSTTSRPLCTSPNTVYCQSKVGVIHADKNCDPALFGSLARAMERVPPLVRLTVELGIHVVAWSAHAVGSTIRILAVGIPALNHESGE